MTLELAKISQTVHQKKALIINGKCNKLGNPKIKNFYSSKYTIKVVKRQLFPHYK